MWAWKAHKNLSKLLNRQREIPGESHMGEKSIVEVVTIVSQVSQLQTVNHIVSSSPVHCTTHSQTTVWTAVLVAVLIRNKGNSL